MPASRYRTLLLIALVLILYGSLYPYQFVPNPHYRGFLHMPVGRSGLSDIVLNVFLYVPFGLLLFHSLAGVRRGKRIAAAAIAGTLLSALIEALQGFDVSRDSSLSDIVSNGTGSLAGALLAAASERLLSRRTAVLRDFRPALLAAVWALFELYPLMPDLRRAAVLSTIISRMGQPSGFDVALFAADWLAALVLVREILPVSRRRLAALFVLLMPVKPILLQRQLASAEVAGAVAALAIFMLFGSSRRLVVRILPVTLIALLIARELAPFRFGAPTDFSWLPFGASMSHEDQQSLLILFRKAFVYGSAIWFLMEAGAGMWRATLSVSFLLVILEWVQRWIPGRTPEITDSVLALLMGAVLALAVADKVGDARA